MTDTVLFMNLIKSQLCGESDNSMVSEEISPELASQLMDLARMHDLTPIIGSQLLDRKPSYSEEFINSIQEEVCLSACHYDIMNYELQWLKDILENAGIPHIALKGAVMRNYYPEPWLRTSGDIDILIPQQMLDKTVSLLSENGCTPETPRRYHDVPLKTPACNLLELHFSIQEDIPALDETLNQVWDFCEIVPGKKYEYLQTKEFLLFHLLAHMSYHLIHGGCGIRSFVDIWLLHQNEQWNDDILQELLSQSQLTNFYNHVMALNKVWFEGTSHNNSTLKLQELVINGGTFGTREKEILLEQAQAGSKAKYVLWRIFMPRKLLSKQYPILNKYPILFPLCQFLRWIRILIGNRNTVLTELQASHSHSSAQIRKTKEALGEIGLNF